MINVYTKLQRKQQRIINKLGDNYGNRWNMLCKTIYGKSFYQYIKSNDFTVRECRVISRKITKMFRFLYNMKNRNV